MFLTRMIDQKRRYKHYKKRLQDLPPPYRQVLHAVDRYVWLFASGRGDSLLPVAEQLVDLFEQNAANGTKVRDLVGDDPVEFAEAFMRNYPESMWILGERERLVRAVQVAERREVSL
jgi:DNA-binding ferritin-like protein (Dps family)